MCLKLWLHLCCLSSFAGAYRMVTAVQSWRYLLTFLFYFKPWHRFSFVARGFENTNASLPMLVGYHNGGHGFIGGPPVSRCGGFGIGGCTPPPLAPFPHATWKGAEPGGGLRKETGPRALAFHASNTTTPSPGSLHLPVIPKASYLV